MPVGEVLGAYVGGVKIPESTKSSLSQRLSAQPSQRWPGLSEVKVRLRSVLAYVDGRIDGEVRVPAALPFGQLLGVRRVSGQP